MTSRSASVPAIIYSARALRDFGDGFVTLLLPALLAARGFDAFQIGVVATLALLGSACTTILIGFVGSRYSTRSLLIAASVLMMVTGLAFAMPAVSGLIFILAFVGTINPSSGSVSIFVPLEHTGLSHSVTDADRTKSFARYSLIGSFAAALGALAAAGPEFLVKLGLPSGTAMQLMFVLYGALGAGAALI